MTITSSSAAQPGAEFCAIRDENKLRPEDRVAHDWYRFVLSFPAHLVSSYLGRFRLSQADLVLDPFCGTGTTLVECKKRVIPSIGLEASPIARFAASVKVDWSPEPVGLRKHAGHVSELAHQKLRIDGIDDFGTDFFPSRTENLRKLPTSAVKLLLTDSISPLPLHKTLVLLEAIEELRDDRYTSHEQLALAKALVTSISNLRFGPEVGVGRIQRDAPVIAPWLDAVCRMTDDLVYLRKLPDARTRVVLADAREPAGCLEPRSISAVITSPPYPNEKDYTRTTRLESVLLGFIRDKHELRALKLRLMRSNTRGVYKHDGDDRGVAGIAKIQELAAAIERRRQELGKTSGFEKLYARVTKLYFGGMMRHLAALRGSLKPGAQLAYVVGDQASYLRIKIKTGELLGQIAAALGYELVGVDLFRTRLATATKEQLREEVLLLRWPG